MSKDRTLRNVFTVGAFTMLSRVLGLVREMLQSRLIGAGIEQSAFTLAFAIPNMARKLFGEGALTAAFVPVFRGEVESVGLEKASRLARAVMTMVLLLLGAVVALALAGILGTLALHDSPLFAPRAPLSPRVVLMLELVAILMPYMLAICGAAFGMGVLNALGRFKASSFMPALLNVLWIAALGVLAFFPALSVAARIRWVAGAILFGGFVQMAYMFRRMAAAGVSPLPIFSGWRTERVRLVWTNLGIAAFGAGAVQVNYMLDQVLAQLAAPWAAGVIGYAERLMDLPLGVIGVAFGTVLLPTFAGFFAKGDVEGARSAFAASVEQQMFVMIPAAFGLAVTAPVVTAVIYEGGSFDAVATARVARALAVYALGLGFFGLQKSLIPWFQAQNDMKTPLKVSVATVAVNATLNVLAVLLLPVEWRHVGLAASTVFCAAVGCAIFLGVARRRGTPLGLVAVLPYLAKAAFAALAMAAVVFAVDRFAYPNALLRLAADLASGGAVYLALSFALGTVRIPRRRRRSSRSDSAHPPVVPMLLVAMTGILAVAGCGRIEERNWVTMGTTASVKAKGASDLELNAGVRLCRELTAEIETLLNAHNPESELSKSAALSDEALVSKFADPDFAPHCHPQIRDCLAAAFRLRDESGGAFNPRWRGPETMDLGGIAKGYAVDVLANQGYVGDGVATLYDIGGNLKCRNGEWRVGVAWSGVVLTLTNNQACATSGEYFRGKHIYDARTGRAVTNGLLSVTIVHPDSAMLADGLSTICFILGEREGSEFLRKFHPEAQAVWVRRDRAP